MFRASGSVFLPKWIDSAAAFAIGADAQFYDVVCLNFLGGVEDWCRAAEVKMRKASGKRKCRPRPTTQHRNAN
jgi:hypothetical protein